MQLILLFLIGLVAGFINVMAGGGSALTLPMLIFLGLDGAVANGTNRLALLIQNIFAVWGFNQNKLNSFKNSFFFAALTLPGAVLGAILAVQIDDAWFKKILGVVIIFIISSMAFPKPKTKSEYDENNPVKKILLFVSLFAIGFYGGFIQAGVGFIIMASLFYFAGLDLVKVNVHKVFIVLIYTIPALSIFAFSGKVDWLLGFVLAAGNGLGAWISAHVSVKKGEKIVRIVLVIVLIAMSIKLIFF